LRPTIFAALAADRGAWWVAQFVVEGDIHLRARSGFE